MNQQLWYCFETCLIFIALIYYRRKESDYAHGNKLVLTPLSWWIQLCIDHWWTRKQFASSWCFKGMAISHVLLSVPKGNPRLSLGLHNYSKQQRRKTTSPWCYTVLLCDIPRNGMMVFFIYPIPLTSGQFVNRHISVFAPSRPMAGVIAKLAQFGFPVLAISTLSVLSRPPTLIVCSKNAVAKLLRFLLAAPTLSSNNSKRRRRLGIRFWRVEEVNYLGAGSSQFFLSHKFIYVCKFACFGRH